MDTEKRTALLESLLGRLLGSIAGADSKVGAIFATDSAMLAVLAALAPTFRLWACHQAIPALIAGLLLLSSILMLSFASFPRTRGPKNSLLFFGSICKRRLSDYLEEVEAVTPAEYLKDLATQCHRNAEIAARKYFWLKRAMSAMYLSVPFWLAAIFVLYRSRS